MDCLKRFVPAPENAAKELLATERFSTELWGELAELLARKVKEISFPLRQGHHYLIVGENSKQG